ncbi:hypothetical protein PR003_g14610 [Phytophthora rubi]|uniref:Uncharacterized protein n=1 Tax=Phytophthora rubi TaxID=129364 RepID=A0A6A3P0B8_9STRA|nr:hypothetical protein PR002_g6526 [Phytophthora rubi]KAE9046642.1 hypothetical protein PR001_g4481 [Phytophthora rubi]KAE9332237.1 hypothetical protein PR003_g14610 [Phytophthora rubi]
MLEDLPAGQAPTLRVRPVFLAAAQPTTGSVYVVRAAHELNKANKVPVATGY